ncbi:MAG: DeoR/GlpR family DNA-binding transcription regulator [Spirochaetia bacterium]|nr:DeoR/GlpR family DNA-binding transcription regulator [Spirochaetia bacterium]MCF7940326.1 DeoR/GlpR family DNA-binding transcription regulator [Spirochaetia bacterium]
MIGLSSRENQILETLRNGEKNSVSELSHELGVSVVTIRADLKSMEEKGVIVRTRGGAIPAFHPEMMDRIGSRTPEKERIAKAAADLVKDGDKIMITNGTTSALVGRYLLGRRDVQIVTNSTLLLPYARVNPNLNITFVGGEFRPSAEALVGPEAIHRIDQFHVSMTITGTDGVTSEHGLTTHLVESAEIVRKMCEQAETRVLVVDSSKFGKKGFVKILPLEAIDIIITDTGLDQQTAESIEKLGIEVHRV